MLLDAALRPTREARAGWGFHAVARKGGGKPGPRGQPSLCHLLLAQDAKESWDSEFICILPDQHWALEPAAMKEYSLSKQ